MPSEYTIAQLISIGRLSQVLANVGNQSALLLNSGNLDQRLPISIYQVWKPLSLRYAANPSDSTLRQIGEWLLQLCGPYALKAQNILNSIAGGFAAITGPTNQSVNVGQSATFSIAVTSSSPYTIQWYRNGNLIAGATGLSYILTNAQSTDSGSQFSAIVTNASGPISSNTATLTVTAVIVGFLYQGTTDFSTQLLAGTDSVPYLGTFPITTGQPLSVTFPDKVATEYIVVKYPATETTKVNYLNPPPSGPDAGSIPSLALVGTSFGGWKYIFSRTGNTFGVNGVNGIVQFS